jgi:hypothetical protein
MFLEIHSSCQRAGKVENSLVVGICCILGFKKRNRALSPYRAHCRKSRLCKRNLGARPFNGSCVERVHRSLSQKMLALVRLSKSAKHDLSASRNSGSIRRFRRSFRRSKTLFERSKGSYTALANSSHVLTSTKSIWRLSGVRFNGDWSALGLTLM